MREIPGFVNGFPTKTCCHNHVTFRIYLRSGITKMLFMKRLLIAGFLIISSATILAVTSTRVKNEDCQQKSCCMKKCKTDPKLDSRTDNIFWEPMGRLMVITP
jgi:hypothetical protein